MKSLIVTTLALGLFASGAAAQGVVIHGSSKDLATGKVTTELTYVQNGMARMENLDAQGKLTDYTIFRDQTFWDVDVSEKTYKRIDKAGMQQAMQQVNAMMAQMKANMANMPADRRAMMQQMLDRLQGKGGEATAAAMKPIWKDDGKTEQVGSFSCHDWSTEVAGTVDSQMCVTPWSSVPNGDQISQVMHQAKALLEDMISLSPFPAVTKQLEEQSPMAFAAEHGLPVVSRDYVGGKPLTEDTVTGVEKQSIDASKFEVPKGYKEKPLFTPEDLGGPGGAGGA
jgi:hypothetical protein